MERYYTYKKLTSPSALIIIPLAEIKAYLKLDSTDTSQDSFLTQLISTVVLYAEKYTKREFLIKQFLTYRDDFFDKIELRRSKISTIDSMKYYKDDVLETVDSDIYYNSEEDDFSSIYLKGGESYPIDFDDRVQTIQITFKAGYGDTQADIPPDLIIALKQHVAKLYENLGDCPGDTTSFSLSLGSQNNLPTASLMIYNQYRIEDITI